MKKLLASILSAVLLLGALASCGASGADSAEKLAIRDAFLAKANEVVVNEDSVTFVDASGSETPVTIKKNPEKTINLLGSFTTLWYEAGGTVTGCIGGEDSVELYKEYIGRDITQDEGVTVIANSSSGKNWNVENIIAMQPDLIICSVAKSGYSTIEAPTKAAGIPVIATDYNDFSDYLKWFKIFCNLSGHPELWENVALKALDEVTSILAGCPTEDTPTVFCMFASADDFKAQTSYTVVGSMIKAMNAGNICDAWDNPNAEERIDINLETVYAADPDMIIVAGANATQELIDQVYGDNPVWQELRAVKEGKVYFLEKQLFHYKPNSRFVEAYATLADILYPDAD